MNLNKGCIEIENSGPGYERRAWWTLTRVVLKFANDSVAWDHGGMMNLNKGCIEMTNADDATKVDVGWTLTRVVLK